MLNLERLGNITAELSANLVKSIVLPGGLLGRLTRPAPAGGKAETRPDTEIMIRPSGPLALIGVVPVPDEVAVSLVHFCGGRAARLGILSVGVATPHETAEKVSRLFNRFGMRSVETVTIATREEADRAELADRLVGFEALAVCADDGLGALEILNGTLCGAVLQQVSAAGRPLVGFHGGSDLLAERILLANGSTVAGLGLAPRVVVSARGGERPLLSQLVQTVGSQEAAQLLGVSLDDATALLVRDGEARVVGAGSVTFVDGRETTALETAGAAAPICGVKVHVLVSGFSLSLKNRKPIAPVKEPAQVSP